MDYLAGPGLAPPVLAPLETKLPRTVAKAFILRLGHYATLVLGLPGIAVAGLTYRIRTVPTATPQTVARTTEAPPVYRRNVKVCPAPPFSWDLV